MGGVEGGSQDELGRCLFCSASLTTVHKGEGVGLSRSCIAPSPEPRRERHGPPVGVREKPE